LDAATIFSLVVAVLKVAIHRMVDSMKGISTACGSIRANPRRFLQVRQPSRALSGELIQLDQLTIMVESSRLFLFTEYARKGCGVIDEHGTDYKVWEALPVSVTGESLMMKMTSADSLQDRFSANKRAQELLARVKEDKIAEKRRLAPYYFGGFTHGANTSDTEGVHSADLDNYSSQNTKANGTNSVNSM
jgi:homogentisate 1,2-dioxygenase